MPKFAVAKCSDLSSEKSNVGMPKNFIRIFPIAEAATPKFPSKRKLDRGVFVFDLPHVIGDLLLRFLGLVFAGKICGVREGTAAAALCVGLVTRLIGRIVWKKK